MNARARTDVANMQRLHAGALRPPERGAIAGTRASGGPDRERPHVGRPGGPRHSAHGRAYRTPHASQRGGAGRDAAIIDIAQDLLLRHLHGVGVLDSLAFKGGTSLRELYAGNQGRFSLDLDFSGVAIGADPDDALTDLIASIDALTVGPFRCGVIERRGKWTLTYEHSFGGDTGALQSKLDLNPPPWLPPVNRGWVHLPVHDRYGQPPLPQLQIVRLEENLAEKVARLNRTTPARDM